MSRALPPPTRLNAAGVPMWHITVPLTEDQLARLEIYRISRRISRSQALRQIITEHLPTTPDAD